MTGAISRGLTLRDFETMNIGQIVDYCITYNNIYGEKVPDAEQEAAQYDFDAF